MRAQAKDIKKCHTLFGKAVSKVLGFEVAIKPEAGDTWSELAPGQAVSFHLQPKEGQSHYVYLDRPHYTVLIGQSPTDIDQRVLSAGWQEEWVSEGDDWFALVSAAWTFFHGVWGQEQQRLVRAEWYTSLGDAGRTPQPHWHFDRALVWEEHQEAPGFRGQQVSFSELEELPSPGFLGGNILSPAIHEVAVSGVHLGMGGWLNSSSTQGAWQMALNDGSQLVDWAVAVLGLAQTELNDNLRIESVSDD